MVSATNKKKKAQLEKKNIFKLSHIFLMYTAHMDYLLQK